MNTKFQIIKADITKLAVEAIVNPANKMLLGGMGLDGAIHKAAGPYLLDECRALKGCNVGEAKITKGYELPAKFIIHTACPAWRGGGFDEEIALAKCYNSCLGLAVKKRIKTIAFPSLCTGPYGFPISKAAPTVFNEVKNFVSVNDVFEKIIFVLFSDQDLEVYKHWYHQIFQQKYED